VQRVRTVFLSAVAALYLVGLSVYCVALALGRARAGPLGFAREVTPYLFTPVPVIVGAGVVLRAVLPLVLSVPTVVCMAITLKPVWLVHRGRARPSAVRARFRILTLNAGGNARVPAVREVERTVERLNPDIVALQELTPETLAHLRRSLAGRYAYCHGWWPTIVFSRLPIRAGSLLPFPALGSDAQLVEIEIAGRTLALFNVHFTRPGYELKGSLAWLRLIRNYDPTRRDSDVAVLQAQVGRAVRACVLAGDLNASEWSHPYRLIRATMVDAFRQSRRGWGNTYRAGLGRGRWHVRIPLARIDYVFHSSELVTFDAQLGPDSGSEHLPVVADLGFQ
jgi:endonuclease/exonuclease/phosphatase family metal-dependent hydrolase